MPPDWEGWSTEQGRCLCYASALLATPVRFCGVAVTHSKNYCQWLKLVPKDFENDCVIDCALQILCSRTAAERNDIVNRTEG